MAIQSRYPLVSIVFGLFGAIALGAAAPCTAQPRISGFTGTLALPDNVDQFYAGVNKLLVTAGDGLDRISEPRRDKVDHTDASLESLRPGTAVVVRYSVKGIATSTEALDESRQDKLNVNEGTVTSIDRSSKRISVAFPDGSTQKLRLTEHPVAAEHPPSGGRAIVYYADESGVRVPHYFKPSGH